jgi:hypothetical protein
MINNQSQLAERIRMVSPIRQRPNHSIQESLPRLERLGVTQEQAKTLDYETRANK